MSVYPTTHFDQKIAIVGGGLVGPTAELFLRAAGFSDVTTYEATTKNAQSGGIVGLNGAASFALRGVGIDPDALTASQATQGMVYDISPDGETTSSRAVDLGGVNVAWDVLHQAVTQEGTVRQGKRAIGIAAGDRGAVVSFDDSTSIEADIVVFADGRNSFGRSVLGPQQEPTYQDHVIWRGITRPPSPAPDCFSCYKNTDEGVVLFVSDPITRGVHSGRSDWLLYQNVTADAYRDLLGITPQSRYYVQAKHVTTKAREALEGYAQAKLPEHLAANGIAH